MNRRTAFFYAAAALSALTGWFLPDMLAGDSLGFISSNLLIALQEILLIGLPAALILFRSPQSSVQAKALFQKPTAFQTGLTMLSAVSYTMAGLLITLITYLFLQQLGFAPVQPDTLNPESAGELALAALCAAVIPALCEELLFRGLVQGVIARRWGDRPAVWLTSLLFALMHFTLLGFPVLLVIGLLLSRLMLTGKTLLLTMIFHAMYNFSVLTINYSGAVPGFGVMLLCAAVFWLTSRFLFKEVPNEI